VFAVVCLRGNVISFGIFTAANKVMDNIILNFDQHMLCQDDTGNIQMLEDPENPGLLVYDKLSTYIRNAT